MGISMCFRTVALPLCDSSPEMSHDTLHVVLDTHEIQITGKHLREVAVAFQKFAVDWLRELPGRYVSQADDGHAWITGITVTEAQG